MISYLCLSVSICGSSFFLWFPFFRYNACMKLLIAALAAWLAALSAAPVAFHGNALGDPKAPITIEVFSDFQCPACKRFHDEELLLLVRDYVARGKVYLVYRYFPLPQHAYGRKAAELACACAQLGKYEPAADVLFAKQDSWSKDGKLDETLAAVISPAEWKKVVALVKDPSVQAPNRSRPGGGPRASAAEYAHRAGDFQDEAIQAFRRGPFQLHVGEGNLG